MTRLKLILDTSILIGHWQRRRKESRREIKSQDVMAWAKELIDLYQTNAIVTPVYVEMVAGVTSSFELKLTRVFLSQFQTMDEGKTLPQDWALAIQMAQRIPENKKPRNLGDCLIRAMARRLKYEVKTLDKNFPR